jgi:predicted GNAT superfamily acetyltransferase
MKLRDYREGDLPYLHEINEASTPGVSSETEVSLAEILELSHCIVAEDEAGFPVGFISLIEPGTQEYNSPNLRWFEGRDEARSKTLIYVDRIALHPEFRSRKLGEKLYRAAIDAFQDRSSIGCEVNTRPENPGSMRFHERMGFRVVGEQAFSPEKAVAYYLKEI